MLGGANLGNIKRLYVLKLFLIKKAIDPGIINVSINNPIFFFKFVFIFILYENSYLIFIN